MARLAVFGAYQGALHASRHQFGAVDAISPTLHIGGSNVGVAMDYTVTGEANPRALLQSGAFGILQNNEGFKLALGNGTVVPNGGMIYASGPAAAFPHPVINRLYMVVNGVNVGYWVDAPASLSMLGSINLLSGNTLGFADIGGVVRGAMYGDNVTGRLIADTQGIVFADTGGGLTPAAAGFFRLPYQSQPFMLRDPGNTFDLEMNHIILARPAVVDIVNSAVETNLINFTVPGNLLGLNRILRYTAWGSYLNNSGVGQDFRTKVYFGAAAIMNDTFGAGAIGTNAARRSWFIQVTVNNQGAANIQGAGLMGFMSHAGGPAVGYGDIAFIGGPFASLQGGATAAVDSTLNQNFMVSIQHSNALATIELVQQGAILELI